MSLVDVRDSIVARRRERIATEGHAFGHPVPTVRHVPLVPFTAAPLCICEIKRRSPSRGSLAQYLDPVVQAGLYRDQGCRSVSVLTEEDWFGGSLDDLMAVKSAWPDLAVLRKDFLVDRADVDIAFRAGADAILLIASMLDADRLTDLHRHATGLGMEVLVELHSFPELDKVRALAPPLVGINCRDLQTFSLDLLHPLSLIPAIDWPCTLVFESGLFGRADALYAARQGFRGILVGEAVVKQPSLVRALREGLITGQPTISPPQDYPRARPLSAPHPAPARESLLWGIVAARRSHASPLDPTHAPQTSQLPRPLVKICGLTRESDVHLAASLGADLLGFVFADSPRRASLDLLKALSDLPQPRIAVVVARKGTGPLALPPEVLQAWDLGLIHGIQFSGDESPDDCSSFAIPFYKALRPTSPAALAESPRYPCPRILLDAAAPGMFGGTGHSPDPAVLKSWQGPLWLAGGIRPDNVVSLIAAFRPELIDLSSGIESSPGSKDPDLLTELFQRINQGVSP